MTWSSCENLRRIVVALAFAAAANGMFSLRKLIREPSAGDRSLTAAGIGCLIIFTSHRAGLRRRRAGRRSVPMRSARLSFAPGTGVGKGFVSTPFACCHFLEALGRAIVIGNEIDTVASIAGPCSGAAGCVFSGVGVVDIRALLVGRGGADLTGSAVLTFVAREPHSDGWPGEPLSGKDAATSVRPAEARDGRRRGQSHGR